MLVPNRNYQSPEYRYGFQGQEKDDEVKGSGNSVNYKYRMHDPRIGRFFAVDPLSPKYPHYTPYSFSGNKVIHAIELEGLEEIIFNENMNEFGETILNISTKDEVLINVYNKVTDQTKCNIKLYIASIDPSILNKGSSWGGRTYSHNDLKILANNVKNIEKYIKDTKIYDRKHGTTTPINAKSMKRYKVYKAIFKAFGIDKENVLNETTIDYNLILINENDLENSKIESLAITVTHEIDAHFEENINNNKSINNSHHFKYFDYDESASNLTKEEKGIIEVLKKGSSPPTHQYKVGSEAYNNYKAIKRALDKIKKEKKAAKKAAKKAKRKNNDNN